MEEKNSFNGMFDQPDKTVEKELSLADRFTIERAKWTTKVKDMSIKLKRVVDIQELQGTVYTDRQMALEYYYMIVALLLRVNKEYRKQYAQKFDHYSFNGQKRFPNESSKNNKILSEMEDIITKKESLEQQSKFITDTVKTIDNIIYGMKYRIELEQLLRAN